MEKLRIYQASLSLVKEIYQLISLNPKLKNDYSLCDQLKRASVSGCVNIAEGYQRSLKQNKNYLQISSGSTNEMVALLQIVSLVYQIETLTLQEKYKQLGRQILAFSKTLKSNLN